MVRSLLKWSECLGKLLDKLLGRSPAEIAPWFTPGSRLYCVGDIHGRADLLSRLHGMILADSADFTGRKIIIYLGDYIDRGSYSRQVLELLLDEPLRGFENIYLRGNHEQALLDFLEFPRQAAGWLSYGGLATLLSYEIALQRLPLADDVEELADRLKQTLPASHLEFLRQTELSFQEGSYYFAHAGIRPGVSLDSQDRNDLLWIREDFIRHRAPHEHIIVHGHTITTEPELLSNRIGIDTGAFYSDVLSCLVLEGIEQRVLQTSSNG